MSHRDPDQHVLIVRPGALGDTILSVPLVGSIRERHPGARLTMLGNRTYKDLMPPGVEFRGVDHRDWLWLFHPETVDLGAHARPFHTAYLVLTRPDRVAANLRRAGTGTVFHVASRPGEGIHAVEHLHLGFGLPLPPPGPALTHLAGPEQAKLVWIHPGSGGPGKCIPLQWMVHLSERLQDALGWDMAVTMGEEDGFLTELPEWSNLIAGSRTTLLEGRPLPELCKALGRAGLFVGNDSGIAHLAAGLGIPAAVFFVTTDPNQWAPWVPEDRLRVIDLRGKDLTPEILQREADALVQWACASYSRDSSDSTK